MQIPGSHRAPYVYAIWLASLTFLSCSKDRESFIIQSEGMKLRVEAITDSIAVPFGMTFLTEETLLVTDRKGGKLIAVDLRSGRKTYIENLPDVFVPKGGDSGMLDVAVHPDYKLNGWIYFSYAIGTDSGSTMAVDRAKLERNKLVQRERLFKALPYYKEPAHLGCRLAFNDGYLYLTMGDRYDLRDSAQSLGNHLGKVLRIHDDGRIPEDNPFAARKGAMPEIWSYGHRNPQGLVFHPPTSTLWEHEHGPKGGDEVNIIKPGVNYGWPIVCFGIDYDGTPIGKGITHRDGLEQPIHHYTPSIAPSGMDFYTSDKIPPWKNNLFIGSMALTHLNRLVMNDSAVVREERLLADRKWRIRNVRQGPDGLLYIAVDEAGIFRIRPQ